MKKFYILLGFWAALFSLNAQNNATFENLQLENESWWNGADGSGGFTSGGFWFPNSYDADYGSWCGFSVSNMKDSVTGSYENQYSAIPAKGVNGSENYAVAYLNGELKMELENPVFLSGFYVTNSTFAYFSMKNGDSFSKKFGGADGSDPDFFKLMVSGTDIYGNETDEVEVFLADFTFDENEKDTILKGWEWVDLSSLGVVKNIKFSLESSDNGDWGMNTPAYFCIDNFNGRAPGAPEILTHAGMEDIGLGVDDFYNGSDGAGEFSSGGFTFRNSYNAEYESWSGFAASSGTDTVTSGYSNPYSAITGEGAMETKSYAVSCPFDVSEIEFSETIVSGFYITNSTYAYQSMMKGDDFAKIFGGADGDDPDWFKVTIAGVSAAGDTTGTIDHYLADFRFESSEEDYIVDDWQWIDLSGLGKISKLRFSLASSDNGQFGMNTPGFFCIDQLNYQDLSPEIINPIATIGENDNPEEVFYVTLDSVFTDPDDPDSDIELKLEHIGNPALLTGSVVVAGKPGTKENTQLAFNITPEMTGEAEVVISATSNGKKVYHSFTVIVQFPVSSLIVETPEWKVYPNPVKTNFNVELPAAAETMILTNSSGQTIFMKDVNAANTVTINALENQSPGIYFLKVKFSAGVVTRKILKY